MRRIHLFELEDLRWLPHGLRDAITDFLQQAVVLRQRVYDPAVPLLADLLRSSGQDTVVDLCAGGTGPWVALKPRLEASVGRFTLVFTDRYPNLAAFDRVARVLGDERVRFETAPVDATAVPSRLSGVRTLFTSFHHFRPEDARRILADAFEQRTPICVFEFTGRRLVSALGIAVIAPALVWLGMPRLRPLTWPRLLFTYLVPLIPLAVAWDAAVSYLRTYRAAELEAMTSDLCDPCYRWRTGEVAGRPRLIYLIGQPTPVPEEPAHA